MINTCQYRYNPTELYQRTKPGTGVETICGAPTYPAVDEPELIPVQEFPNGPVVFKPTGRFMPRGQHDPYCPAHGGSPEPPPPPATMAQLQAAFETYTDLASRFPGAVTAAVPDPLQIATGQVTPELQQSEVRQVNG